MTYKNETRTPKEGYILVEGMQDGEQFGCPDFPMAHAETKDGHYIGSPEDAEYLVSRGISPELANPSNNVCSIGFSEKEQKWFGWSHRAICGFGIGYVVKEGDCVAESGWIDGIDPHTGQKDTLPLPVGFEVKSLDDAKRVAIAFAASVS